MAQMVKICMHVNFANLLIIHYIMTLNNDLTLLKLIYDHIHDFMCVSGTCVTSGTNGINLQMAMIQLEIMLMIEDWDLLEFIDLNLKDAIRFMLMIYLLISGVHKFINYQLMESQKFVLG